MAYVTITTWELSDGSDWETNLRTVREHRLPALIAMGATKVTVIRTSDRTSAAISEWPDARRGTTRCTWSRRCAARSTRSTGSA